MARIMYTVSFQQDLQVEVDYLNMFLAGDDVLDSHQVIFQDHPELKKALEGVGDDGKCPIIKAHLEKYYEDNGEFVAKSSRTIQEAWREIEKEVSSRMSDILKLDKDQEVVGYLGSIQICPRDIDQKNFLYCHFAYTHGTLVTIGHELFHMIYFDLWKELFPQDFPDVDHFSSPLWKLSEVMVVAIMTDERILELLPEACNQTFSHQGRNYNWYPLPDTNHSVVGYFRKLYLENKAEKGDFHKFLGECREKALELEVLA